MFWVAVVCSLHIGCVEIQTPTQEECIAAIPEGIRVALLLEREFSYEDENPRNKLLEMDNEEFRSSIDGLNYQCVYYDEDFGVSVSFPNL